MHAAPAILCRVNWVYKRPDETRESRSPFHDKQALIPLLSVPQIASILDMYTEWGAKSESRAFNRC